MTSATYPEPIANRSVLDRHLEGLVEKDPRLAAILKICGDVPLRNSPDGFPGMVQIVVSQLLSVKSAEAIHGRVVGAMGEVRAPRYVEMDEAALCGCGLSRGKWQCLRDVAAAEMSGDLDYGELPHLPVSDAMKRLTAIRGIGPWTAEIYLLFCTGHPDIFPAGDLALQKALALVFQLDKRPHEKEARHLTASWTPYRGAAARLMWRYYAVMQNSEGIGI